MQNNTTICRRVLLSNQKNKGVVYNNPYQIVFAKPTKQQGLALTGANYRGKSNCPTPEEGKKCAQRAPKKTLDTRQKRKSAQQIFLMQI